MYIRSSPQACYKGFVARNTAARDPGRYSPVTAAGRLSGQTNSWRAAGVARAPGYGAADVRCSRAENAANEEEPNPAVDDGYDAA